MRFFAGPRLLIIDLCRPRDYADMGGGLVVRALIRAGFGRVGWLLLSA
jgi:hypothetical protein